MPQIPGQICEHPAATPALQMPKQILSCMAIATAGRSLLKRLMYSSQPLPPEALYRGRRSSMQPIQQPALRSIIEQAKGRGGVQPAVRTQLKYSRWAQAIKVEPRLRAGPLQTPET